VASADCLVALLEIGLLRIGMFQVREEVLGVCGVRACVLSAEARCRHRRQIMASWSVLAEEDM
jgi:hypothetical protein